MRDPYLDDMLKKVETQIELAYACMSEGASNGGVYMYSFNTGQTTQSVTKSSLHQLDKHIDSLMAKRDNLRQRLGMTSIIAVGRPCY